MKKKVLAAILIAVGVLTGCGNTEPISSPIQTVEAEPIARLNSPVQQRKPMRIMTVCTAVSLPMNGSMRA